MVEINIFIGPKTGENTEHVREPGFILKKHDKTKRIHHKERYATTHALLNNTSYKLSPNTVKILVLKGLSVENFYIFVFDGIINSLDDE